MTIKKMTYVCIASVLLLGCSNVYRTPGYETAKTSELALLEHRDPKESGVIIGDIDGKWRGLGAKNVYELSPGEHSITASVFKGDFRSANMTRWFKADTGGMYEFISIVDMANMKWNFHVVDKKTSKNVDYSK